MANLFVKAIEEPTPRQDGLCYVCEKPVTTDTQYGGDADAFCSSRCCRSHFGCELEVDIDGSAIGKARREAEAAAAANN